MKWLRLTYLLTNRPKHSGRTGPCRRTVQAELLETVLVLDLMRFLSWRLKPKAAARPRMGRKKRKQYLIVNLQPSAAWRDKRLKRVLCWLVCWLVARPRREPYRHPGEAPGWRLRIQKVHCPQVWIKRWEEKNWVGPQVCRPEEKPDLRRNFA